jgi:hypothetical protein
VKDQNQRVLANMRTRILGRSKWNLLLGIIATIILIGSFSALAYNTLSEKESDMFTLNGKEYGWNELGEMDTIEVQGFEGVPLVFLIEDAGVDDPSSHDYRLIGADGYFKTVTWRDVETGILTLDEKKVVFETKAKAYWVRDVVEIEVI